MPQRVHVAHVAVDAAHAGVEEPAVRLRVEVARRGSGSASPADGGRGAPAGASSPPGRTRGARSAVRGAPRSRRGAPSGSRRAARAARAAAGRDGRPPRSAGWPPRRAGPSRPSRGRTPTRARAGRARSRPRARRRRGRTRRPGSGSRRGRATSATPYRSAYRTGNTVTTRLTSTKATIAAVSASTGPVGTGICSPSETKNSVTKKSRSALTFATMSTWYGNVATLIPATSAPSPSESRRYPASPHIAAHHAVAETSRSSGCRAARRNTAGRSRLAAVTPASTRSAAFPMDVARDARRRSERFGWTARKAMAHRSCRTSTPSVIREVSVSSSIRSESSFTTIEGRRQRRGHREVGELEGAAAVPRPEEGEEAERRGARSRRTASTPVHDHRPPRLHELVQVDLEAEDEHEQDEADLGERRDARGVVDEPEPEVRPEQDAGGEIAEHERHAREVKRRARRSPPRGSRSRCLAARSARASAPRGSPAREGRSARRAGPAERPRIARLVRAVARLRATAESGAGCCGGLSRAGSSPCCAPATPRTSGATGSAPARRSRREARGTPARSRA